MIVRIAREWESLDAIVNNAAVLHEGLVTEHTFEEWRETIDVDLTGPFLVTRSALKIMNGGNIVQVTSGLGSFPMQPYGASCVAKAGFNMLTRVLALELGERFRVNAIDPGEIRTRMNPKAEDPSELVVPIARSLVGLARGGPTGRCYRTDGSEVPWT